MSEQIEKPEPPMDGECCESGCTPCIWDSYYEQLQLWREDEQKRASNNQPSTE